MRSRLWLGAFALLAVGCGGSSDNDNRGNTGNNIASVGIAAVTSGNRLVVFNSNSPDVLLTDLPISGLPNDTDVAGIDYRPANGACYLVTEEGGLYQLDLTSAAATFVGTIPTAGKDVEEIDFNPVADRLRVATDDNGSLRVNVTDATAVTDTPFAYADNRRVEIQAVAYTNSTGTATSTVLYGIDTEQNALVRIDPPNDGVLTRVGGLGINVDDPVPFDISPTDSNVGIMAIETNDRSRIVSVDISNGSTIQGRLTPRGRTLVGLTVVPPA